MKRSRPLAGLLTLLLPLLLMGCVGPAPRSLSPNFDQRHPVLVVIHHTGDESLERAKSVLTDPAMKVSAHYLIDRDGTVLPLVDENERAWHAGAARWGVIEDVNSASIGIELVNNGDEAFPDAQIGALLDVLADLKRRHHLPRDAFVGHADVAPKRKADPNQYFPWATLAARGFGLWCPTADGGSVNDADGTTAEDVRGLRALGYDMSDPDAAIRAFRRHFLSEVGPARFGDRERRILGCLLDQGRQ